MLIDNLLHVLFYSKTEAYKRHCPHTFIHSSNGFPHMAELLICGKVRAADMGRSVGRVSAEMKDLLP